MESETHLAEYSVFAVEVRSGHSGDKKLAAVGVGAGVGHRQQVLDIVGQSKATSFVGKLFSVNTLATGAIAVGEISALAHGLGDDSVEPRAFVGQRLLGIAFAHTACASAEGEEVFDGSGSCIIKHLENDALWLGIPNFDVPGQNVLQQCEKPGDNDEKTRVDSTSREHKSS